MSARGDHEHSMSPPGSPPIDDAIIEALVAGSADLPPSARMLTSFVADVRAAGERPPPPPSPRLEAVLADRARAGRVGSSGSGRTRAGDVAPVRRARRRRSMAARLAGAGLAVKVGVAATVAAASVVGASALDVVPGQPGDELRKAVSAVTPLDLAPTEAAPPAAPGGEGTPDGDHDDRAEPGASDGPRRAPPPGRPGERGHGEDEDPAADGPAGPDDSAPTADSWPDGDDSDSEPPLTDGHEDADRGDVGDGSDGEGADLPGDGDGHDDGLAPAQPDALTPPRPGDRTPTTDR